MTLKQKVWWIQELMDLSFHKNLVLGCPFFTLYEGVSLLTAVPGRELSAGKILVLSLLWIIY